MPMISAVLSSLLSTLTTAAAFLFVLSIVVVIHELGHFLVARWCGVKVDAFAMGFGREVYGWNDSKGTRWRLNWIPLGGYVKFMDDANGASMPDNAAIAKMSPEERATSFHAKPLWQRAAVIFAGPFANFLLAVVLLAGLAMFAGVRTSPARVEAIMADSPAAKAGLRAGDLVTSLDGTKIDSFSDLMQIVSMSAGRRLALVYDRDGKAIATDITPGRKEEPDGIGGKIEFGDIGLTFPARVEDVTAGKPAERAGLKGGDVILEVNGVQISNFTGLQRIVSANPGRELPLVFEREGRKTAVKVVPDAEEISDGKGGKTIIGRLGLRGSSAPATSTFRRYGPVEALGAGVRGSVSFLTQNIFGLGRMIKTGENVSQLGGPAKIAAMAGQAASMGFSVLINLAAAISLSVGFFNLLPVPPLDGGHLMFYAAELVRGRPLGEGAREMCMRIGVSMIATLFVFLMWNDRFTFRYLFGG